MTNHPDKDQYSVTALASRLRAARESKGLTQAQAASELGVSRPLLIAIEKGTRDAEPRGNRQARRDLRQVSQRAAAAFCSARCHRRAVPRGTGLRAGCKSGVGRGDPA